MGTFTIDLLTDGAGAALSQVSTDRIVSLSSGTSGTLITITGSQRPGQRLTLYNIFGNTITIQHTAAATDNTILTPDANDFTLEFNMAITLVFDITTAKWRIVGGSVAGGGGNGGDTGTFISAALSADQITNIAVNDHIEFDTNTPPTGADGGIVLQTGAGQLDGIFELISGKTYFLSASVNPLFSGTNDIEVVWYDITNATELGRRTKMDSATLAINQPKNEIIYTPTTDVTVEVRIVSVFSGVTLTGFDALYSFASIFEFSGTSTGGALTWKLPARAKSTEDVTSFVSTSVLFDGVTLVEDDRVLLTDQTTLSENGLYEVGVVAAGLAPLTRPADFDTSAKVVSETFVAIEEGSQFADRLYHLTSNNPITIDVSNQVWTEFAPGTSGGPDLGGGGDGIDAAGEWVYDGRTGVAADYLKIWENIDITGNVPEDGIDNMIYLPTTVADRIGRLVINGQTSGTKGGALSDNYGASWSTIASLSSPNGYGRMAYAPNLTTNGTLTIIRNQLGFGSPQLKMQFSTDRGTSFSNTTMPNNGQDFVDQIFIESLGLFVATSAGATTNPLQAVYTSTDGDTWIARTTPSPTNVSADWQRIVFSPSLGKIYIKNDTTGVNDPEFIQSTDGINWTGPFVDDHTVAIPSRIIWSEGQQKFASAGGGVVSVSDDFITWTDIVPPDSSSIDDIVYAPDLSLWLVIGTNSASTSDPRIFFASNDLDTWSNVPTENFRVGAAVGVTDSRTQVAYAEEFGYFFGTNSGSGTGERLFRTAMKIG